MTITVLNDVSADRILGNFIIILAYIWQLLGLARNMALFK